MRDITGAPAWEYTIEEEDNIFDYLVEGE